MIFLSGCLPPLSPSGEPLAPVPAYVTSVKIDPRTLEPVEKTDEEERGGERPDATAPE